MREYYEYADTVTISDIIASGACIAGVRDWLQWYLNNPYGITGPVPTAIRTDVLLQMDANLYHERPDDHVSDIIEAVNGDNKLDQCLNDDDDEPGDGYGGSPARINGNGLGEQFVGEHPIWNHDRSIRCSVLQNTDASKLQSADQGFGNSACILPPEGGPLLSQRI